MDNLNENSYAKFNRHSKMKKDKLRDVIKKEKKKTSRLSSIERDYLDNISSETEEFVCLGENELLDSLNKLNFVISDSEDIKEEEEVLKIIRDKKKFTLKKADLNLSIDTEYYPVDNFSQFNRDIKLFLKDPENEVFETAPAPPVIRKYIHLLSSLYRIKTFSVGKGADKRTVLQKIENSGFVFNARKMDKIIEQGNKAIKWHISEGETDNKRKNRKFKCGSDNSNISAKPIDGTIVGERSVPIKEDNVGNQMLQKMGWTPGTGLGRESTGIIEHIPAVIKTKRSGII